jgi:G:T-mismatch repair DNA endonuclease (very short patch repair protein)
MYRKPVSAKHCEICGFDAKGGHSVGHHVKQVHKLSMSDYRKQYNVPQLTTAKYPARMTEVTCYICSAKRLRKTSLVETYKSRSITDHTCGKPGCAKRLRALKVKIARNTPESKANTAAASVKSWANNHDAHVTAIVKGMHASAKYMSPQRMAKALATSQAFPTKPEQAVLNFVTTQRLAYKYVGNGALFVEQLNPDFVSTSGPKQVILVQGCYWHGCRKCYPMGRNRGVALPIAKAIYRRNGYTPIVIWEHELKSSAWQTKLLQVVGR